jgi:hypothetical protein
MRYLRTGSALLVAAVAAAAGFAQTNEELQRQFNELKAEVKSLRAENAALKAQYDPESHEIETEVNRLSTRMAAATNLRSCASQIKLGGEFRFRGYYGNVEVDQQIGKVVDSSTLDGFWGDARIRLNFQYDFGCDVTAFAELQSRWAFGESTDGPFFDWTMTRPDEVPGDIGTYQAWLEFRNVFCRPELSARIGRQEAVFGNQFQFGNADWYNGVVHDGLRVDWRANCWDLTLLAMKLTTLDGDLNQVPSYFNDHDDDELYAAYFTLRSIKNTAIDLYWIYVNGHGGFAHNSGASFFNTSFLYPLQNAYFHTFGARVGGTFPVLCGLDYNVEGAIQTGETHISGLDLDTDGYAIEAEVGLTFDKRNRFRVFARGLLASGADDDSAGYLILFPNRHSNTGFRARYGLADLLPMTNVLCLQAGAHFDPVRNWTIGATGLWAETEEDLFNVGNLSPDYGMEIDVWAEYRYSERIAIGAGVALVFPDESGEFLWSVNDATQVVGYMQARLIF